ncbi:Polysaccharide biosynthesis protein [Corynebacterium kalinowskii]|uniref:Polysaccharide biosynthesis protein n=1 Tax=Corynebacterium kalinowskii TaxID=2675216 RepID=A0A6B8V7A1_9CORY|nr:oligosaccharide flippase family protein [Corynebacterium kalinowskii]QGU01012.1 Polysaccharide biosynthesis protein [Corynebacterium kalinowskii]
MGQEADNTRAKLDLIKNTVILAFGKFSSQIIVFLMLPLYTSYLSPNEYGVVDLVVTYAALLAPTLTIQMEMAVFRFLIENRENKPGITKVITNALSVAIALTIICLSISIVVNIFVDIPHFYLILCIIVAAFFAGFLLQTSRGLGKNLNYAIASILTGLTTVISNVMLIVVYKLGATGMLVSLLLSYLIPIIYLLISLKFWQYLNFSTLEKTYRSKLIRYSAPLVPNGVAWWVINAADRTIILFALGLAANGVYAVSTRFAMIYSAVFAIFSMSWTESASVHIRSEQRDRYFTETIDSALRFFGSVGVLIIAVLPFVFTLFVAENFREAYLYIPLMMIGAVLNSIVGLYGGIYVALKKTGKVATTSVFATVISLAINLVFIKVFGLFAAASAGGIAFLAMAIYRHFDLQKFVAVRFRFQTLGLLFVAFGMVTTSYYLRLEWLHIIALVAALIFGYAMNRNELKFLGKKALGAIPYKR